MISFESEAYHLISVIAGAQASPIPIVDPEAVAAPGVSAEAVPAPATDSSSPVSERGCKFWCY